MRADLDPRVWKALVEPAWEKEMADQRDQLAAALLEEEAKGNKAIQAEITKIQALLAGDQKVPEDSAALTRQAVLSIQRRCARVAAWTAQNMAEVEGMMSEMMSEAEKRHGSLIEQVERLTPFPYKQSLGKQLMKSWEALATQRQEVMAKVSSSEEVCKFKHKLRVLLEQEADTLIDERQHLAKKAVEKDLLSISEMEQLISKQVSDLAASTEDIPPDLVYEKSKQISKIEQGVKMLEEVKVAGLDRTSMEVDEARARPLLSQVVKDILNEKPKNDAKGAAAAVMAPQTQFLFCFDTKNLFYIYDLSSKYYYEQAFNYQFPYRLSMVNLKESAFLAGGNVNHTVVAKTSEIFPFKTKAQPRPQMLEAMQDFPLTAMDAEKQLVTAGGEGANQTLLNISMLYNRDTSAWEYLPNLFKKRKSAALAAAGKKLFVFGGFIDEDMATDAIEKFDFDNKKNGWISVSAPNPGSWSLCFMAAAFGLPSSNRIIVYGGPKMYNTFLFATNPKFDLAQSQAKSPSLYRSPTQKLFNGELYMIDRDLNLQSVNEKLLWTLHVTSPAE